MIAITFWGIFLNRNKTQPNHLPQFQELRKKRPIWLKVKRIIIELYIEKRYNCCYSPFFQQIERGKSSHLFCFISVESRHVCQHGCSVIERASVQQNTKQDVGISFLDYRILFSEILRLLVVLTSHKIEHPPLSLSLSVCLSVSVSVSVSLSLSLSLLLFFMLFYFCFCSFTSFGSRPLSLLMLLLLQCVCLSSFLAYPPWDPFPPSSSFIPPYPPQTSPALPIPSLVLFIRLLLNLSSSSISFTYLLFSCLPPPL